MPALSVVIVAVPIGLLLIWRLDHLPAPPLDGFHSVLPPDEEEAHEAWQLHADCDIDWCPAKAAAYWLLADAGHLVPTAQMFRKRVTA